ncbi:hypothetical protein MQQ_00047 [Staphylococcus aureus subsp. aureus VRS9]|nr:hypothetical protein MQQ_00047 [Staphylococcus aureus subsp. aureus VRS9]
MKHIITTLKNPSVLEYKLLSLYEDSDVSRKLGIFEYLLSGEKLEFIK